MVAKPASEIPAVAAQPRGNVLVSSYLTVTELLCPDRRDVLERDHVLSFLLDQICRTTGDVRPDEEVLVAAALTQFGGGFPAPN